MMKCITTVRYSVVVNGQPTGDIRPTRGLRQGDPLSPYLFLLCAEVLSSKLQVAKRNGWLRGVPTSVNGPRLTHLFFVDESLLFCKVNRREWHCLCEILDIYERASGQRLNKDKTTVFFSRNTTQEAKEWFTQLSEIPESQRFDTYLGLPTLVGKSRVSEFHNITDRVRRKVSDWKTKFLSQAGKEILIKAVVQAIPTYSMSIFLLPKTLCKELNSLMQNFWWGHKENDKKIHWMSWEKMGFSKDQGGMGFRDLSCFNKALLAKQWWRLLKDLESLTGQILKAKYFKNVPLLSAQLGSRPSYAWRSLLSARDLFVDGLIWRVGDGEQIRIWGDRWIPRPSSFSVQTMSSILPKDTFVKELFDQESGGWNLALIREVFMEEEADVICNLPRSKYHRGDTLIWRCTPNGSFTVRSAYYLEKSRHEQRLGEGSVKSGFELIWKMVWSLQIPNASKVFLWRACSNILPTKDNLVKKGVLKEDSCIFCGKDKETVLHILWDCPSSQDVWGVSARNIQKSCTDFRSFMEVMEYLMDRCNKEELGLFAVTAKKIWARRNAVIHEEDFQHPNILVREAREALELASGQENEDTGTTTPSINVVETQVKWRPPPFGCYKLNWDVALDFQNKLMGIGVVVRDHQGEIMAALRRRVTCSPAPIQAESAGALAAAEFSRDLGLQDLILEGDSISVVNALRSSNPNWSPHGQIIEDACGILFSRRSWEVLHVKRGANMAAHTLAKDALLKPQEEVWIEECPTCIFSIIDLELNALVI
jgi:hypothetical protein